MWTWGTSGQFLLWASAHCPRGLGSQVRAAMLPSYQQVPPCSREPCGRDTSSSVPVGVLGDFHFQAVRIYTQEELLHGYGVYGVTLQPAGGTCAGQRGGGRSSVRLPGTPPCRMPT